MKFLGLTVTAVTQLAFACNASSVLCLCMCKLLGLPH